MKTFLYIIICCAYISNMIWAGLYKYVLWCKYGHIYEKWPIVWFLGMLEVTNFMPIFYFYIPWKCQKIKGFLTFSGGIEMKHWFEWVNKITWEHLNLCAMPGFFLSLSYPKKAVAQLYPSPALFPEIVTFNIIVSYHKSYLSWNFHVNFSSRSEDRIFRVFYKKTNDVSI